MTEVRPCSSGAGMQSSLIGGPEIQQAQARSLLPLSSKLPTHTVGVIHGP